MRSSFAVTTPLVLLMGIGMADAADPTQLAETGGLLLGNGFPSCTVVIQQFDRLERHHDQTRRNRETGVMSPAF